MMLLLVAFFALIALIAFAAHDYASSLLFAVLAGYFERQRRELRRW